MGKGMGSDENAEIPAQFEQFREAWETYDNTGDRSLLKDVLAENVVHISSGGETIAGREALIEALPDVTDRDWEFESDNLVQSGDLAVEQFTIHWTKESEDGEVETGKIDSVDVYQRQDDGSWSQIVSLPRRSE